MPIDVPGGVQVTIGDDNTITVKGSRGQLTRTFSRDMSIRLEDKKLLVERPSDDRVHRSMHGLTRTLLANMIRGVSPGFVRLLDVSGVGYRVQKTADALQFQVGFSSAVDFRLPSGIDAAVEGNNRVRLTGYDKELLGQVAASVRAIRPCDHYKGKGIKYAEEKVRIKPGKAGKVTKG